MSLAAAAVAAMAVGTGMEVYGQIQAGRAAEKTAEYNAALARRDADIEKQRAEFEEAQHRRRVGRFKGRQQALFAKAGVQLEGSPLLVMEETAAEAELEALAIRRGGEIKASRFMAEAGLRQYTGKQKKRTAYIRAGASLLTGAGETYLMYR